MVTLWVYSDSIQLHLTVPEGKSVRDVLDATELRVRAACGGTGACGACLVRLLKGDVNPPTLAEFQKLTEAERANGMRLACQLRLRGDAEVRLDDPAPPSPWKSIPPEDLWPAPAGQPDLARHIYGVAVDLGTTHVRVALWDRKHGQRLATRRGPNPQSGFGADVLNRLDAALASPDRARELAKLARGGIVQAVRDILKRDMGEVGSMLAEIGRVVIVGNTAMWPCLPASAPSPSWNRPTGNGASTINPSTRPHGARNGSWPTRKSSFPAPWPASSAPTWWPTWWPPD
jgi:ferredoxin